MKLGKFKISLGIHRRRNLLIIVGSVVVVILIALRLSVAPILKRELIATVEKKLYAKLIIGDLSYSPPYGVIARDCRLVPLDASVGDLLDIKELSIRLASLPLLGGPLVVEDLAIHGPSVHLVRTAGGFAGETGLLRPEPPDTSDQPNDKKFSDLLRLRHLLLDDGQVVYEDRRRGVKPPTSWNDLGFEINTSPIGPADYGFNVTGNNTSAADLQATGTFNVDDLTASLEHFSLTARAGEQEMGQLPPELQEILGHYRVGGTLFLEGKAHADARNASGNSFSSTISLQNGTAFIPEARLRLNDLHFHITSAGDQQGASIIVENFAARSGNGILALHDGARCDFDAVKSTWSLQNLAASLTRIPDSPDATDGLNVTGSAQFTALLKGPVGPTADLRDAQGEVQLFLRRLSIRPPTFPLPVSQIDGPPIQMTHGMLVLHDLQARYGRDQFLLSSARIWLGQIAHASIRWSDVNGELIFVPPNSEYPYPLDVVFKKIQPGGEYVFSSHGSFDRGKPAPLDYDALLSCDNGTLSVMDPRFNIFQIKFDSEVTPSKATLPNFSCRTLEGKVTIQDATFAMSSPNAFSTNLFVDRVSLSQAAALASPRKADEMNLQGMADVHTTLSGQVGTGIPDLIASLAAEGQLEIYGSNLWDIPALKKIMESSSIAKGALTIGQAAALFRVKDQVIELQEAAVTAPAAGVHGHGTIGFNGNLDIYAIVALLGNWRDRLQHSDFSFLADVAGDVQKTLDQTTKNLLYQVHVSGPAGNPNVGLEAGGEVKSSAKDVTNMLKHSDSDRPMTLLNQNGGGT
jgi:AsmA-like C-terminal region